jgi:hypothetical protein
MADEHECPQCGGPGTLMGVLGNLAHLRCRDCGWTFSIPAVNLAYDRDQGDDDEPAQAVR